MCLLSSHSAKISAICNYRVTLYVLLFGLSGEQFLELTPSTSSVAATAGTAVGPGKGIRIVSDTKTGFYHTTGPSSLPSSAVAFLQQTPGGTAANSTSSSHPELIRQEVAVLKADFNARLYQILFNTVVSAYYGAVIPCLFAQVNSGGVFLVVFG